MNINQTTITEVLYDNPNELLTVRDVMAALNLNGEKAMRRASRELGRIYRKDSSVKREKSRFAFAYQFVKSPTKDRSFAKSPKETKDKGATRKQEKRSKLSGYTYIEELEEPKYDTCELCGVVDCEIAYRAETSRGVEFLCEKCGVKVNKKLGGYAGYGGVFE